MSMKMSSSTPGALSETKLRGIYWKTFVGFVRKDDSYIPNDIPSMVQLSRRQGSFEYMELTARGGSTATSDSVGSCVSSTNSSMESLKEDRSSMYAILDMSNTQKEISLNNDITIIEEPGAEQRHLNNKETVDNDRLSVDDESEENSFDRLESVSPSMEPAPWKDQNLSIQLWMVPHFLSENDDKLVSMPPFPEFDHCHYVPTLEAILEESEESSESRNLSKSRLTKSASYSDDTDLNSLVDEFNQKRSNSLGDVVTTFPHSQDDLYSITSTFGSVNSMRRITTFENLSTEEKDGDDNVIVDSDGSSDELDRAACYDSTSDRNSPTDSVEEHTMPTICDSSEISQCDVSETKSRESISNADEEVNEETSGSEVAVNAKPTSESSRDIYPESAAPSVVSTDFLSSGRSSPMIESAPEFYEFYSGIRSKTPSIRRDSGVTISDTDAPNYYFSDVSKPSTFSRDSGVTISDIDVPGLPQELYFDSKDLPQIVVMFAQQEIEKERRAKEEDESDSPVSSDGFYRRRSDRENEFESPQCGAVQKRISQLKLADTSRLSVLSSSTPELSAVNDECLLYIPVSYAGEAAAKKKRKRNAPSANSGAVHRRTNLTKALHTRSLISGTGLGNGFSSLRKRLRSRKSTSSTLRRSQSEKPQLSYSSPDVSGPMARFLNSPRRRAKLKSQSAPDNDERKGKSIKKTFSKVIRRLSSKFSSQRRPVVVKKDYKVIEQSSPAKSSIDEYAEDTSETQSSQSKDSPSYTPYKYGFSNDLLTSRAVDSKFYRDYRNRSQSVPMRPRSQTSSLRNGSTGSDVFDSLQSEESLDKTVYV